ncbi:hypothetical protein ABTK39_19820, partial [Acinetobacter baumannii]
REVRCVAAGAARGAAVGPGHEQRSGAGVRRVRALDLQVPRRAAGQRGWQPGARAQRPEWWRAHRGAWRCAAE